MCGCWQWGLGCRLTLLSPRKLLKVKSCSQLCPVRCFIPLPSSAWHTGQMTVGKDRANAQFSLCCLPPALCSQTTGSEGLGLNITCNSSRHISAFMAGGQKTSSNGHHAPISSTQHSRSCGCYHGGYYQPLCFHLLVVMTEATHCCTPQGAERCIWSIKHPTSCNSKYLVKPNLSLASAPTPLTQSFLFLVAYNAPRGAGKANLFCVCVWGHSLSLPFSPSAFLPPSLMIKWRILDFLLQYPIPKTWCEWSLAWKGTWIFCLPEKLVTLNFILLAPPMSAVSHHAVSSLWLSLHLTIAFILTFSALLDQIICGFRRRC